MTDTKHMSSADRLAKANKVTDKEHILNMFDEWDGDKNGSISCMEMRKVLIEIGLKADQVKALFQQIDANRDGEISFTEFTNWLFSTGEEAKEAKKFVYRTESPKEALSEFMAAIKEVSEGDADLKAIFAQIDASGNKSVNMTEFVAGAKTLGIHMDEKMLQKIFSFIDTERKKAGAKKKAPKVSDDWDKQFKDAGVKSDKHVKMDAYALAGMPNMEHDAVMYCGSNAKLQGKLIHHAGEYTEVITKIDPKTGKEVKITRKVNEGGVPDHLISFKEFEKAFQAAVDGA